MLAYYPEKFSSPARCDPEWLIGCPKRTCRGTLPGDYFGRERMSAIADFGYSPFASHLSAGRRGSGAFPAA